MGNDGDRKRLGIRDRLITGAIALLIAVALWAFGAPWIIPVGLAAVAAYQFVIAAIAQGVATGRDAT